MNKKPASKGQSKATSTRSSSDKKSPRRGAARRARQKKLGNVRTVDERKVLTSEEAEKMFMDAGRSALAGGMVLRVTARRDADAFPNIVAICRHNAAEFTERQVPPHHVAGAGLMVDRLNVLLGPLPDLFADAPKKKKGEPGLEAPSEPISPADASAVMDAYAFVSSRRRAVLKVAKGRKNAALRKAFGLDTPVDPKQPQTISQALLKLLEGRAKRRGSVVAGLIGAGDVRKARAHIEELAKLKSQEQSSKGGKRKRARELQVLQAGLELFYDRYSAACELVFEDDELERVEALQLVPQRDVRRRQATREEQGGGNTGAEGVQRSPPAGDSNTVQATEKKS